MDNTLLLPLLWVDEKNPEATDSGPGTREKPFKSYEHAATVARRGRSLIIVVPQDIEDALNKMHEWTTSYEETLYKEKRSP